MNIISIAVSALYTVVNFMLLVCSGRLLRRPISPLRCLIGAAFGGSYAMCCLLSGIEFINNGFVYLVVICSAAVISFGFSKGWLASAAVYVMLTMSLGGIDVGTKGVVSLLIGSVGICLVLFIGQNMNGRDLISVEIDNLGETIKLTALMDSGNLLTDPVTGRSVLIVGADVAQQLTGLSSSQLRNPVESIAAVQGLRLIPYNTISERGRFLLAKRMNDVQIGSWKGSVLVAFCPELLSASGKYQALVGGNI